MALNVTVCSCVFLCGRGAFSTVQHRCACECATAASLDVHTLLRPSSSVLSRGVAARKCARLHSEMKSHHVQLQKKRDGSARSRSYLVQSGSPVARLAISYVVCGVETLRFFLPLFSLLNLSASGALLLLALLHLPLIKREDAKQRRTATRSALLPEWESSHYT